MNKLTLLLSAILAVVLVAGPSFAAEMATEEKSSEMVESTAYTRDQLVGLKVFDKEGKAIGEIRDVSLNSETGEINFVLLSEGGILGIGEERHAVPLAALEILTEEKKANLLVSEDKLENVPEQTVGVTDEEFKGIIEEYYGVAPAWHESEGKSEKMMEEEKEEKSGY